MMLDGCRVVLVRPQVAGNLGATARVMRNMGLSHLVLVAPQADPDDREARQLSTHGESILDHARIVPDLSAAVADCAFVAGTSARTGGLVRRQSVAPPDEVMPRLVDSLAYAPAALVFGPEPMGLSNAEVMRCHYLIHIPADPGYPALNLAQAVAICLYELRRAWMKRTTPTVAPTPAPFAEQERMFEQLQQALEDIHFLYGDKAESLMHALRHLIGRAQPSAMEVKVLLGLARQLRWYAGRSAPTATQMVSAGACPDILTEDPLAHSGELPMSSSLHCPPVTVPAEVFTFAEEQGVSEYLPAVLAMTQQRFPHARRLSLFVEPDPEIANLRFLVLEVEVSGLNTSQYVDSKFEWSRELVRLCPAPRACAFILALEIVDP